VDCFLAVQEAIAAYLELPVRVLGTSAWETFETLHNLIGGGHILATVAHNVDIVGLCLWFVGNWVSCSMENGDNTAEHLEMAAVK